MIDTETRPTGVKLRLLDLTSVTETATRFVRDDGDTEGTAKLGFEPYALAEVNGNHYVICSEGVGWPVTPDQPLEIDIYVEHPGTIAILPRFTTNLTLERLQELATGEEVDLADHIRRFGARLEDNFRAWHRKLSA